MLGRQWGGGGGGGRKDEWNRDEGEERCELDPKSSHLSSSLGFQATAYLSSTLFPSHVGLGQLCHMPAIGSLHLKSSQPAAIHPSICQALFTGFVPPSLHVFSHPWSLAGVSNLLTLRHHIADIYQILNKVFKKGQNCPTPPACFK